MYLSHLVRRRKLEGPMSPEDQDQGQHKQQREDLPQKKKNWTKQYQNNKIITQSLANIGQNNTRTTKS